jgi:hypothetical protein
MAQYSKTLEALARTDAQGWPLADALAAEMGGGEVPHKAYIPVQNAAKAKGLRVPTIGTMRQYRATGAFWQGNKVTDSVGRTVGFSAHKEAQRAGKLDAARELLEKLVAEAGGDAHKVTVPMVREALGDKPATKGATVASTTVPAPAPVDTRTPLEVLVEAASAVLVGAAKDLNDGHLVTIAKVVSDLDAYVTAEQARRARKANRPAPKQVKATVIRPSAPVEVKDEVLNPIVGKGGVEVKPAPRKRMRG